MKTHNLIPGTPEWHAHRETHDNASDAPAVLGCSPYKTRDDFLREKATGAKDEVSAATQDRFNDGHKFEALARPIGEEIIGDDLAPVVGSEGTLSASFDGLTLMATDPWEHKTLNDDIRASLPNKGRDSHQHNDGAKLSKVYRVQMEQQLMLCGDKKCLFSATRWNGDQLVEERHAWYHTDPVLRAEIVAGWKLFAEDLAKYVPPQRTVEAVGKAPASLSVVFDMRVEGKLVSCNLEQYKPAALAYIAAINTELLTDQNFADADADAKFCRDSADKLELAIEQALGQMGDINQALNTVREIAAAFDAKGLALEKLVKAEKENRRNSIISEAAAEFVTHMRGLNERLGGQYMPTVQAEFQLVCKGLKSIDSTKAKVSQELARVKIESSAIADRIQANLLLLAQHADMAFLFNDKVTIVLKQPEDFAMLVKARVAEHQAEQVRKEEEQREKIRAEEQAKAARALQIQSRIDAFATVGEPLDVRTADDIASIIRTVSATVLTADLLDDRVADAQAAKDAALKRLNDAFYAASQKANAVAEEERKRQEAATPAPVAAPTPAVSPAPANVPFSAVAAIMPPAVRQAMAPKAATPKPETPPSLTLGEISTRLQFNVTSAFLATLGFEATTVRAAKLYHEADFLAICEAIRTHISNLMEQFEPETA